MKSEHKIKVLIVDDSPTARELIRFVIENDPRLEIAGFAEDGKEAIEMIEKYDPDVVTMDLIMPRMDGFEATRQIMSSKPKPIIIISSKYNKGDVELGFKAIDAGALAILEKPKGLNDLNFLSAQRAINNTIRLMSEIKLITRRHISKQMLPLASANPKHLVDNTIKAIGIGASLGGPPVIHDILACIPENLPVPIFLVQHITSGFCDGFCKWLQSITKLKVSFAIDEQWPQAGTVYIAPDDKHLEVLPTGQLHVSDAPKESGIRPSINRLFRSMAKTYQNACAAVILTGMGKDGAEGVYDLFQKKAAIIVQKPETCTADSMPKAALAASEHAFILPSDEIRAKLLDLLS